MALPPPPGSLDGAPAPRMGTGWTVVAACAGALAGLGVVGTIWLLLVLPTHDDGGHGGDGATALAVLMLGGAWTAVLATVALVCAVVGGAKRHRATVAGPLHPPGPGPSSSTF